MSDSVSSQPLAAKSFSPAAPLASPPKAVRKPRRLKPTQQAFVRLFTTPNQPAFGNGTEAYVQSHPTCKSRQAAAQRAHEALESESVNAALAEAGWTSERLQREMEWNVNTCKDRGRFSDHREGIKVLAQLRGEWKDRSEVDAHVTQDARESLRRLVAEAITKQAGVAMRPVDDRGLQPLLDGKSDKG